MEEYKYLTNSFLANEELGERRLNFFITIGTAILGGILVSAGLILDPKLNLSQKNKDLIKILLNLILIYLFFFGYSTFKRIIRRNKTTDEFKIHLGKIRKKFKDKFPEELMGFRLYKDDIEFRKIFTGGIAEIIIILNSTILAMILFVDLTWINIFIALLNILVIAFFSFYFQLIYLASKYYDTFQKHFCDHLELVNNKNYETNSFLANDKEKTKGKIVNNKLRYFDYSFIAYYLLIFAFTILDSNYRSFIIWKNTVMGIFTILSLGVFAFLSFHNNVIKIYQNERKKYDRKGNWEWRIFFEKGKFSKDLWDILNELLPNNKTLINNAVIDLRPDYYWNLNDENYGLKVRGEQLNEEYNPKLELKIRLNIDPVTKSELWNKSLAKKLDKNFKSGEDLLSSSIKKFLGKNLDEGFDPKTKEHILKFDDTKRILVEKKRKQIRGIFKDKEWLFVENNKKLAPLENGRTCIFEQSTIQIDGKNGTAAKNYITICFEASELDILSKAIEFFAKGFKGMIMGYPEFLTKI